MATGKKGTGRLLFWCLFLTPLTMLFAWLALDGWKKAGTFPDQPQDTTVEAVAMGGASRWMRLTAVTPLCDQSIREKNTETVVLASEDGRYLVPLRLKDREFCATLPTPLLVTWSGSGPYRHEPLLARARQALKDQGITVLKTAAGDVELNADPRGNALETAALMMVLCVVFLLGQGMLFRQWRTAREVHRGSTTGGVSSSTAAPGAADVLGSLASGVEASAQDALLPGPLRLTARAQSQGWRAKHLGAPLLALCGVAALCGAGWSANNIIGDALAWKRGVKVPAEAKGKITRHQLIGVSTDVDIVYLPPLPDGTVPTAQDNVQPRQANVTFMTWFVGPNTTLGDVRVPADDPGRVVVEDAVTLWPWRAINPLLLLLLVGLCVAGAWTTFKNADRLLAIAADPEEVTLDAASWTELRVNGQHTGYSVRGVVRGVPVTFSVGPKEGPQSAVWANAAGDLVVLRARGNPAWSTLLMDDLFPFAVDNATRVRVQAVLQARGSPTRIRT